MATRRPTISRGSAATYRHTQKSPLCLLLYVMAAGMLVLAHLLKHEPPVSYIFLPVGVLVLILAASFHDLTVEDEGDRLSIRFGPLPLFGRGVRYDEIQDVEIGRTSMLDGWGIHLSLKGGWVWNIWGRDCVVFRLRRSTLRVGTDDAEELVRFVRDRIGRENTPD